MIETANLTGHFLIAMPTLADDNFSHTVTYICQHDQEGALGVVINRPAEVRFGELLDHLTIHCDDDSVTEAALYHGGPVQPERGFVLHSPPGEWSASLVMENGLALTTSRDIIEAIAHGHGPQQWLAALGYAGWGPGQLEQEMAENAWLSGPADIGVLFDSSVERRWPEAAARLGIDLSRLATVVGHA